MLDKEQNRKTKQTEATNNPKPLSLLSNETTGIVKNWTAEQEANLKKQTEEATTEELAEGKRLWNDIMTRAIDHAIQRNKK